MAFSGSAGPFLTITQSVVSITFGFLPCRRSIPHYSYSIRRMDSCEGEEKSREIKAGVMKKRDEKQPHLMVCFIMGRLGSINSTVLAARLRFERKKNAAADSSNE